MHRGEDRGTKGEKRGTKVGEEDGMKERENNYWATLFFHLSHPLALPTHFSPDTHTHTQTHTPTHTERQEQQR